MNIYLITVKRFKQSSPIIINPSNCYVVANDPVAALDLYVKAHGKIGNLDRFSLHRLEADSVLIDAKPVFVPADSDFDVSNKNNASKSKNASTEFNDVDGDRLSIQPLFNFDSIVIEMDVNS